MAEAHLLVETKAEAHLLGRNHGRAAPLLVETMAIASHTVSYNIIFSMYAIDKTNPIASDISIPPGEKICFLQ